MSNDTAPNLINVREAAKRLDISTVAIYRARKRGTLRAVEGDDAPKELSFEAAELERWTRRREELRRLGQRHRKEPAP